MTKDFLFEIGVEEMPATWSANQSSSWLTELASS